MKVYVINLASATQRLAFQTRQLAALGLAFERIEAISTATLPPLPETFWNGWERPLSGAEKACFLSHHHLWQKIAQGHEPALILEDDAVLSERLAPFLAELSSCTGLDHVTLESRGRKKLISRTPHPSLPLRRLFQDRSGAAAYVLWPQGAAKLLRRTANHAAIADAVLCAAYELSSWQAVPPLAVQLDRCESFGLPLPLQTRSSISPAAGSAGEKRKLPAAFRLRRIRAQLRMGVRQLSHLHDAERRNPAPNPADFAYLATLAAFD
ncbi:glycosyltransferase family 25 protein [Allorhizobium undicola]|uniref:glycosyltransferase family 25 protein n=1 Tax=Allorhizobium undicola TaxID=78527 RepID=UPI003D3489BE